MGQGPSIVSNGKPLTPEEINKNKDFNVQQVLSKDIIQKITTFNQIIQSYNKNDSTDLVTMVKDYQAKLPQDKKINILPLEKKITEFHNYILGNIDKLNPSLSIEQRNAKRKETLKDSKQLLATLNSGVKQEIEAHKEKILENTFLKNDADVKKGLDAIFGNISNIRAKYKYFEHEYINMNLFLIVFLQHTHNTMNDFINEVMKIVAERDIYRQKAMGELIALLVKILTASELDIKPEDFTMINKLMTDMEKQTEEERKSFQAKFAAVEAAASTKLDNGMFATPPRTHPNASRVFNRSMSIGGYIRDGSRFPQSFYDLSNS
jgi:hypothetical protein